MPKCKIKMIAFVSLATLLIASVILRLMGGLEGKYSHDLFLHSTLLTKRRCVAYKWISDGTLWFWVDRSAPTRLNLKTDETKPIPGLQPSASGNLGVVSPNGEWILSAGQPLQWSAYSLTGEKQNWKFAKGFQMNLGNFWLPNGRQWVERFLYEGSRIGSVLHSLDGQDGACKEMNAGDSDMLGILPNGRALIETSQQNMIGLSEYDFLSNGGMKSLFQIPTHHFRNVSFAFSQKSDRIAWLIVEGRSPNIWDRISPYLQYTGNPYSTSLWVSRLDGSGKKLLGVTYRSSWRENWDLAWTPDDRWLSFIIGNRLYSVPAE